MLINEEVDMLSFIIITIVIRITFITFDLKKYRFWGGREGKDIYYKITLTCTIFRFKWFETCNLLATYSASFWYIISEFAESHYPIIVQHFAFYFVYETGFKFMAVIDVMKICL